MPLNVFLLKTQINISYPATGCQKCVTIDDERKLRAVYDLRIASEIDGGALGDEYAGYVFRISGGNDKQGFAMKQGILTNNRVRLLLLGGASCYRQRKAGERKRKSVRGCIVGPDLSVLNLVVVKKGEADIEGLTGADDMVPRRLGPKRASKIRKLFNLDKEDDVRKCVVKRTFEKKGKQVTKSPKIQRLVTPLTVQRKRARKAALKASIVKAKEAAGGECNEDPPRAPRPAQTSPRHLFGEEGGLSKEGVCWCARCKCTRGNGPLRWIIDETIAASPFFVYFNPWFPFAPDLFLLLARCLPMCLVQQSTPSSRRSASRSRRRPGGRPSPSAAPRASPPPRRSKRIRGGFSDSMCPFWYGVFKL